MTPIPLSLKYDSPCDYEFWFSPGHKCSYDSDYDPDFVTSENQLLRDLVGLHSGVTLAQFPTIPKIIRLEGVCYICWNTHCYDT